MTDVKKQRKRGKQVGFLVFAGSLIYILLISGAASAISGSTVGISPAVNSSASQGSGTSSITVSLTTVQTGDLVLVFAASAPSNEPLAPTTVTSSNGAITFAQRGSYVDNVPNGLSMWEYWGIAGLTTGTVSVTTTANSGGAWTVTAIDISGENVTSPFDTASGVPYFGFNSCSSSVPQGCYVPYSTETANDLIIAGINAQGGPSGITAPTGFTLLQTTTVPSWLGTGFASQQVSGIQGDVASPWTLSSGATALKVIDAIKGNAMVSSTTTSTTSSPGSSSLTVDSVNQNGNAITGYFIALKANGAVVASGDTPATLPTTSGTSYTVQADSYGSCTFQNWILSGGSTSTVVMYPFTASSSSLSLTAVYNCQAITTTSTSTSTSTTVISGSTSTSTSTSTTVISTSITPTQGKTTGSGPSLTWSYLQAISPGLIGFIVALILWRKGL